MSEMRLVVDVTNRKLVTSIDNPFEATLPNFFQGDRVKLAIQCVGTIAGQLREIDFSDASFRVGIGLVDARPLMGTFTLTFGGDTTTALNFNADTSAVANALNALAAITTAGGVTVTGGNGLFKVTFNTAGNESLITSDGSKLYPTSSILISTLRDGSGSLTEIQQIKLLRNTAAFQDDFDNEDAPGVTISNRQQGGSGVNEVQRVQIGSNATGGSFALNFGGAATGQIPFDADEETFADRVAELASIGEGNVRVFRVDFRTWDIEFIGEKAGTGIPDATVANNNLIYPKTKIGFLDLNTTGIEELVSGAASVTAVFELEITPAGGDPFTASQMSCQVVNDLVESGMLIPTPAPSYYTSAEVDSLFLAKANNLSDLPSAATARTNLGLGPLATATGITDPGLEFGAATDSMAGSRGTVPAPAAGDTEAMLHGDKTWRRSVGADLELLNQFS